MKHCYAVLLLILALSQFALNSSHRLRRNTAQSYKRVLNKIKRNEIYYTQGIFFDTETTLIESGGLYGESVLVRMEYPSMNVVKKINLDKKYFGEGTAKCGNFVFQLTWQSKVILKYSYPELELVATVPLDDSIREGWGLASDGSVMYVTDGSNNIYYLDCDSLKVTKFVSVVYKDAVLENLNAMAFVDGVLYVNKYFDNRIFKVDPITGSVIFAYDMSHLIDLEFRSNTLTRVRLSSGDVLNGIAYNPKKKVFVVTGKKWGFYYEVNLS